MKARVMLTLDRHDIERMIPASLICETYCREIFRTGRARRIRKERFTESEWRHCLELCKIAYKWTLKTGLPDEQTMTAATLDLWGRLAEYCMEI